MLRSTHKPTTDQTQPASRQGAAAADHGPSVLVARQPIVDRDLSLHGYELLFRDSSLAAAAPEVWTASLLLGGIAELGLRAVVGDALAYLNVSREFLLGVDPLPFGPDGIVLELTEDSHHTDESLLARLRGLRASGYVLALDDFTYRPELDPLVALADVVKLDVLADGLERTLEQVRALEPFGVALLAEKVETRVEFDACLAMGCETFQGYFFARPGLLPHVGASSQIGGLAAIGELLRDDLAREELERIIADDVALSYKLLRYVNSGFFSRAGRTESVRDAITFLGERTVRQWAVVMSLVGGAKPSPALLSLALLRARLCQRVAMADGRVSPETAFMAGMFSVVDALLGVPMETALERLPFGDELKNALLHRSGRLGEMLEQVVAIERGSLDVLGSLSAGTYLEASAWADGLSGIAT